ncbi:uncharacterized protein METZ01_LOCUS109337, partial [marine metagenome]
MKVPVMLKDVLLFLILVMFAFQCEKNHNTIAPNG